VSVVENANIEIVVYVSDTTAFNTIALFKSEDGGWTFAEIARQSKVAATENYQFVDNRADVAHASYTYFLALFDECDMVFAYSDSVSSILLCALPSTGDDSVGFAWSPYNGFGLRLYRYEISRRTQTESFPHIIDNTPSNVQTYAEDVWGYASSGAKFYYQVAACEDNTNPLGFQDKSYSNTIEIGKNPLIYIPNSFRPRSDIVSNQTFKPVLSYVNTENYSFTIYDRWGNIAFHTIDILAGWDGRINGNIAPLGVYSYAITYRLNPTKLAHKYGKVVLLE
jgi:gliding motility-associated-like protein